MLPEEPSWLVAVEFNVEAKLPLDTKMVMHVLEARRMRLQVHEYQVEARRMRLQPAPPGLKRGVEYGEGCHYPESERAKRVTTWQTSGGASKRWLLGSAPARGKLGYLCAKWVADFTRLRRVSPVPSTPGGL